MCYEDPTLESTRIHHLYPPESTIVVHDDPMLGSTIIHNLDPPGSNTGIQLYLTIGSTTGIHPDPLHWSTWIHKLNLQGSYFLIHRIHHQCWIHHVYLCDAQIHKIPSPGSTRIIQQDPPSGSTTRSTPGSTTGIQQDMPQKPNLNHYWFPPEYKVHKGPTTGCSIRIHTRIHTRIH